MALGKVLKKLQCEKELIELLSPEKFKRTRYEFFIIKFMSDYYLECGKIKSSLRVFDNINEVSLELFRVILASFYFSNYLMLRYPYYF